MNNRKNGNKFEEELAELFFRDGYWVHRLTQNSAGQPADIIVVRNGEAYLIDAKDCESDTFPLSRIEGNQRSSMDLWNQCGNGVGWFAIRMRGKIYMISLFRIKQVERMKKSLSFSDLENDGVLLEDWLEIL